MLDLHFADAFTHLFKERRWWLKLGIISALSFVISALALLSERLTQNRISSTMTVKTLTTLESTTGLIVVAFFLIFLLVYILVAIWYQYENIQAAIQKRDSKLIWEYSVGNTLKKICKYFLTNLVYSTITFVVAAIFIGIPIFVTLFSWATIASSSKEASVAMGPGNPALFLIVFLVCGLVLLVVLIVSMLVYVITSAGYLRLIATNTFSEAYNFKANFKVAKKYFWYFVLTFVVLIILSVLVAMIGGFLSVFVGVVSLLHPIAGLGLDLLFQIPITILSVYVSFYIYSRLVGNLYREIIYKEDDLKFLRK